ncbi:MAG: acyltransferase family protein [Rhodobacteraceae bacterium]|nr:acyltransferase family protein [Paracoccaceae bacterium]
MTGAPNASFQIGQNTRLHYIDNIRALLMSMGVILHAGFITDLWLADGVNYLSSLFRMNFFILICGYFAAYGLSKRSLGSFITSRSINFGIPVLIGLLVLNPLTNFFIYQTFVEPISLVAFLSPSFQPAADMPIELNWLLHMWFLIVVLFYCLLISVFVKIAEFSITERSVLYLTDKIRSRALQTFILAITLATFCLGARVFHRLTFELILDEQYVNFLVQALSWYTPYFLFGILLYRHPKLMEILVAPAWGVVAFGLIVLAGYEFLNAMLEAHVGALIAEAGELFVKGFASFVICSALLNLFRKYAGKTNTLLRFLADASYTVYVVHFLMISIVQYCFKVIGFSNNMNYFVSMLAAYAASLLVHKFIVQKNVLAALLLNGKRPKAWRTSTQATRNI